MNAESLLSKLGNTLGIDLHFSEKKTCGVRFGQDEIFFEENNSNFYMIARLGPVKEAAYRQILEGNYLSLETGFGAIGINSVKNDFVLHRVITQDMSYAAFEEALKIFVRSVRFWKGKLSLEVAQKVESNAQTNDLSMWQIHAMRL